MRLAATHVPEAVAFATKPALAVQMIDCALARDVPFSWVAADAVYGVGDVEQSLRRACKGYVLGVKSNHFFGSWSHAPAIGGIARDIAQELKPDEWQRLSAGEATKGPRLHDWVYLELADLEADEYDESKSGIWTRGLMIRRNISDGDLAFFTTWCPGHPNTRLCRRPSLGDQRQLRSIKERAWPRPQRNPVLAWLAPPCVSRDACYCDDGSDPIPR